MQNFTFEYEIQEHSHITVSVKRKAGAVVLFANVSQILGNVVKNR